MAFGWVGGWVSKPPPLGGGAFVGLWVWQKSVGGGSLKSPQQPPLAQFRGGREAGPIMSITAVFFSLQSLCLVHTGKPTGVAVSHCRTWFQTQLILTTCQIRYHGHCGIIVAPDSSEP